MPAPAASVAEVSELLGHADASLVQRVVDTGASIDEIGAAIANLEESHPHTTVPASPRVAQVRRILEGLHDGDAIAGVLI